MLDFDLQLQRGDFRLDMAASLPAKGITGLIGVSGSGKSSLLRALAGLEPACRGQLSLNGHCWLDSGQGRNVPAHRRAVGLVFQHPSLLPHLNVAENLRYAWRRVPASSAVISIDWAIDALAIGHLLTREPHSLSGGEAQRVAIARTLCANPVLMLLDEPLASVDNEGRQEVMAQLEALRDELTMPMIYVSHSLDEVARLSDHLMLVAQGRLVAEGDVAAMLTRFDLPLSHAPDAEALLEAEVESYDKNNEISWLRSSAGVIAVTQALSPGASCRLRVRARDVSLALSHASDSSILNILPAQIVDLTEGGAGQVLLQLRVGEATLLARISLQSANTLDLRPGMRLFAQIKSVALA